MSHNVTISILLGFAVNEGLELLLLVILPLFIAEEKKKNFC